MTRITDDQFWLANAVQFSLGNCTIQDRPVFIETRGQMDGSTLWVVKMHEWVLAKSGFWYREPMPSSRTDYFIKLTRFKTKEAARDAYYKFLRKGKEHILTDGKSRIK